MPVIRAHRALMSPVNLPPATSARRPSAQPAWAFAGLLAALAFVRLTHSYQALWPKCALRLLTGIPCPFCGGARSLAAAAHLDWWGALKLNPLAFALGVGVAFWFAAWAADRLFGLNTLAWFARWRRALSRLPLVLLVLFLNWIYLCFTLPR